MKSKFKDTFKMTFNFFFRVSLSNRSIRLWHFSYFWRDRIKSIGRILIEFKIFFMKILNPIKVHHSNWNFQALSTKNNSNQSVVVLANDALLKWASSTPRTPESWWYTYPRRSATWIRTFTRSIWNQTCSSSNSNSNENPRRRKRVGVQAPRVARRNVYKVG